MKNRLQFKIWQARLFALVTLVALTGCSKTVQWEEEVPLNTGETIWVKRELTYAIQGDYANPLYLGLRAKSDQTFKFDYGGKRYNYKGQANILLIAISPKTRKPVLVAEPVANGWYSQNRYSCTTPFYVQFNPDSDGERWTWPPQIETWLYGVPTNIMLKIPDFDEVKEKYPASGRNYIDNTFLRSDSKYYQLIDAEHIVENCFVFK